MGWNHTNISCGIYQIFNLRRLYPGDRHGYPNGVNSITEEIKLLRSKNAGLILASINNQQAVSGIGIELEKLGFKQVGESFENPNTRNIITLYEYRTGKKYGEK